MHPSKTRNLTYEQKEEIKVKLLEFENKLLEIYYYYNDKNPEKKIRFNELIKRYSNAYNKLK